MRTIRHNLNRSLYLENGYYLVFNTDSQSDSQRIELKNSKHEILSRFPCNCCKDFIHPETKKPFGIIINFDEMFAQMESIASTLNFNAD